MQQCRGVVATVNSKSRVETAAGHTCCKCADIGAIGGHFGNASIIQIQFSNCWWDADVEGRPQVEIQIIVRPKNHVMIAMITRHTQPS